MAKYIEAEKLEKEGWFAARNYQQDAKTMVFESKKMTDFPTADVRENAHAHWEKAYGDSRLMCSVCKSKEIVPTIMGKPIVWGFCPNCGAVIDERREDE